MTDPQQDPAEGGEAPDVNFSLSGLGGAQSAPPPAAQAPAAGESAEPAAEKSLVDADSEAPQEPAASSVEEQATQLAHSIARELAVAGPEGWRRLEAIFALTVAGGVSYTLYYDDADRVARLEPSTEILELVGMQRELSAQLGDGPWWRMVVQLDVTGQVEVDYDYGDEPFPDDQLLIPDAYLADLQAFPRDRVPVWLAAYIGHDNRQWRTPQQAAAQTRNDQEAGITAVASSDDFPVLPVLWARWATIAAAFVAIGSEWGPRILPALGVFEGSARSGSTLYVLPGGRAVLSGGVWDAPELDAAYNDGEPMPDVYAGAPEWVANQVLNPRAARGMLSFCYWWDRGSWYRGESPTSDRISAAVPGVWSAQTVADVVCGVVSADPTEEQRTAAANLVAAAEAGVVTRNTLAALFDDPSDDVDGALYQLSLAGLVTAVPVALAQDRAIILVREHIQGLGIDTSRYPLDELVAERLNVGWMVFVPVPEGEIAIGRAIFYIADDGVIEQSSSSTAPSIYIEGFEERFNRRQTGAAADFTL
ncbi:hypothetical protein KO481_41650 [Nocardia sp. NEAU-G5]|uniref:Uncharacterized protein n=1 Tax=Nocardia albiluteola TaxID=2842303 RepID=A0ABS6BCJ0_9NOCA|nr:hypothetical protein [Nocardia albiluteola]MBU3068007.1 hypothetical protein [Nocardia albiluteola]